MSLWQSTLPLWHSLLQPASSGCTVVQARSAPPAAPQPPPPPPPPPPPFGPPRLPRPLPPCLQAYGACEPGENHKALLSKMVAGLGLRARVGERAIAHPDARAALRAVLRAWLPLAEATLQVRQLMPCLFSFSAPAVCLSSRLLWVAAGRGILPEGGPLLCPFF